MIPVIVTFRGWDISGHTTKGFALAADCPLAVAPKWHYTVAKAEWSPSDGWCLLHRPTGNVLGGAYTQADAERLLIACDPGFPAWQHANGSIDDTATIACHYKFKRAKELTNVVSLRATKGGNKRGRSRKE